MYEYKLLCSFMEPPVAPFYLKPLTSSLFFDKGPQHFFRAALRVLRAQITISDILHKFVYGDQCVDVSTVTRWARRFKDGELGLKNTNFF